MLVWSLLIALLQCVRLFAVTTEESVISTATQSSLNNLFMNAYDRAMVILTVTGDFTNVPLSQPLIKNYVNFTGSAQQAVYGAYVAVPYGLDVYFALANGADIMYSANMNYKYTKDGTSSCPTAINSAGAAAPCRSFYHYEQLGVPIAGSKPLTSASYNPLTRPWYTQAVSRGKLGWSTVFTFASTNPGGSSITGVTISGPWYQGNTNTVLGVVAVDVDYSQITPVLQQYAKDTTVAYLVETSTYTLVATSSGEIPVSGTSTILCTAAKNPTVKNTCAYLTGSTFGSTWASDGTYQSTIGGTGYVMNIVSYTDPQTSTLAWKLIVVGMGDSLPTTNYVTPIDQAINYCFTDIKNRMAAVQTVTNYEEFLTGAHPQAPLTNNLIQRTNPSLTGSTQQAIWSIFNIFKASLGTAINAFSTGYQLNGTYIGYSYNPDGTYFMSYRPPQAYSNCTAITGYSGYSSNCLQKYYVNANGVPTTPYAQSQFDPRTRPWWTAAQSTGVPTWSYPYYSALSSTYLYVIGYAAPIFDPVTGQYQAQNLASYTFNTDWTAILQKYATGYTAYVFDVRNYYLMANNVGASIFSTSTNTYILATQSTNTLIKNSANYLITNGLLETVYETVAYNTTTNMVIAANYWMDSSGTFAGYVVGVQLQPAVVVGTPTMAPTAVVYASADSTDDDQVAAAKSASITAAVFAAILIVLVLVLIYVVMNKQSSHPQASAPPATEMVTNPMPKALP